MRSWSDGLTKKLLSTRRAAAARKQRVSARMRQLQCASGDDGPLAAALKRSRDLRLCYPDMIYSLRHTHGLLTTRRNSLVISLFHHFRLQPMVCALTVGCFMYPCVTEELRQALLVKPSAMCDQGQSAVGVVIWPGIPWECVMPILQHVDLLCSMNHAGTEGVHRRCTQ